MKKLFLENVSDLGDLYYTEILYNYEGVPISFLCENKNGDLVLGHCCEVRNLRRWILVKMDLTKLTQLAKKEISLYSALTINKTVVEAEYIYETQKYTSEEKRIQDVDPLNFPEDDIFLEDFEQEALLSFLEAKVYISKTVVSNVKISTDSFHQSFGKSYSTTYTTVDGQQGNHVGNKINACVFVA